MLQEVSDFYDFAITDFFTISVNLTNSIKHVVRVVIPYLHTKFEVNISIQYRVMAKNRLKHIFGQYTILNMTAL